MAESPYRSGYGVEDRVREPSAEERQLIEERRARDLAIRKKNELGGAKGVLNMAGIAVMVFAVFAVLEDPAAMFGAGLTAVMCAVFGWIGYQKGLERIRARPGRWDAPDHEWRTHETRIRARSVLFAASEDEDYITWLVFEIPGDDWAAIDDLWAPPEQRADLPNDDVVLRWLEPANECLGVEAHGGALPRHGALRLGEPGYDGDDFAQAIADGFGWGDPEAYEEGTDPGEGPIRRVPESELAPWMRAVVREE